MYVLTHYAQVLFPYPNVSICIFLISKVSNIKEHYGIGRHIDYRGTGIEVGTYIGIADSVI